METLNNRILIIDDNESIHKDFKKALTFDTDKQGDEIAALEQAMLGLNSESQRLPEFQLDSAYQGHNGIMRIQEALDKGRPYAIAFVDVRMPPGLDGVETIEKIWKIDPDIQTVICTAYSDYSWEELFKRMGQSDRLLLLKKPFDVIEVRLHALTLTKKWALNHQANLKEDALQSLVDQKTQDLTRALTLTTATLEATADGIVALDNQNGIINYNKKFIEMWSLPESLLLKKQLFSVNEYMKMQLLRPMEVLIDVQQMIQDKTFGLYKELNLKSNSGMRYVEQFTHPQYHHKDIVGMVYSFRDITERKILEKELLKQATYDHLTGLPNRELLVDRIQQAIHSAKRNSMYVAVLFADLDSFKYVNDSLGHEVGDVLLKMFAQRLSHALRESDSVVRIEHHVEFETAARLGGDEFVILLTLNTPDSEQITAIIQRLTSTLSPPYHLVGHELSLTISIGVSLYPQDGDNPMTLIKNADAAMYRAKEKGKATFEFYKNEMSEKSLERLELENDLRRAIENEELSLQYQPLIDMVSKKIVSFEVLMRWQHPKLGLISPTVFIPVAEASGLIIPLGTWALKMACAQNKIWQDQGLPKISIAVNVSGYQLKQPGFVDPIKHILQETHLAGMYLELELTESILFMNADEILHKFEQLKAMGVGINLDDFGTGYSSLSYINQFPITKIKIDQSFIQNLSETFESKSIIQAVVMIAKSFNMKVVAEGVETAEQLETLDHLSADQVQGLYLSKPMSVSEVTKVLAEPWEWPLKESDKT